MLPSFIVGMSLIKGLSGGNSNGWGDNFPLLWPMDRLDGKESFWITMPWLESKLSTLVVAPMGISVLAVSLWVIGRVCGNTCASSWLEYKSESSEE